MFTTAEKENIKAFVKAVIVEQDKRNARKYATTNQVAALKGEIDDIDTTDIDTSNFVVQEDGKGLSEQNFTTEDKAILGALANNDKEGFTAQDVLDIFDD